LLCFDDFTAVSISDPFAAASDAGAKPVLVAPNGLVVGAGSCCCLCWLPFPGPATFSRPKSSDILDVGLRRGFNESLRVTAEGLGSVCCAAGDGLALAFEGARAAAFRDAFLGKAYGSLELDS
jgi:hypothetical protein